MRPSKDDLQMTPWQVTEPAPETARVRACHAPALPFTSSDRHRILERLAGSLHGGALDDRGARSALDELEQLARVYKQRDMASSLSEVMRLLVAASGHDLSDVRERANVALERILAPKDYDAPLATRFVTGRVGERLELTFRLPPGADYVLHLFAVSGDHELPLKSDVCSQAVMLAHVPAQGVYSAQLSFSRIGAVDFAIAEKTGAEETWVHAPDCSGRINVLPDLRGEIVLEIFTDIHGHTRLYWSDPAGHPGLVYDEHGRVIRVATFADVAAHLAHLKARWSLTTVYVLGMQQRGSNRQDWAREATSPSPFAPMSLWRPDRDLGDASGFRALVDTAHQLGIKVIVDVIPHLNRESAELPDELSVRCYDAHGQLVARAATDGRYGEWHDGRLLNYRKLAVWSWLADSIRRLIVEFDIDGIRFDSAHAVPIMMKKNSDSHVHHVPRTAEDIVEGTIVSNERHADHFVTTGFYDCAACEYLAVPLHTFLARRIEQTVTLQGKSFFINIAECFWGRERQLTRSGLIPYDSALFKICEAITRGRDDVRAIYHLFDHHFPRALPEGAVLLGILGNHDEERALSAFGRRGLRAAIGLTLFLHEVVIDFEGNAEGEAHKVYLDNIRLDWVAADSASERGTADFYRTWYELHRHYGERGFMLWANNHQIAAAVKRAGRDLLVGVFNFSDQTQSASLQFDSPQLPIDDEVLYRVEDVLYSPLTARYDYFSGRELRVSKINTVVPFTERAKLFRLRALEASEDTARSVLRSSVARMADLHGHAAFRANHAFRELARRAHSPAELLAFVSEELARPLWHDHATRLALALKRALFHLYEDGVLDERAAAALLDEMQGDASAPVRQLARACRAHHRAGPIVFLSAEVAPFSKSGGLASVVHDLPREMAEQGEDVVVITPRYTQGSDEARQRMDAALAAHDVVYSGVNVCFSLGGCDYEVGVHTGHIGRVRLFMLDHAELFDGLYWGVTTEEKLRRRIGFARACAEVICVFGLSPIATFTNDAYAGLFNGIVRYDPRYHAHPSFARNSLLHIVHNAGWQYLDAFARYEHGRDAFALFDLPAELAPLFSGVDDARLHCMATGMRAADRVFTVSPSYASELERSCHGLEGLMQDVVGISNGIHRGFRARAEQRFEDSRFATTSWPALREALEHEADLLAKIRDRYPEILQGPSAWQAVRDGQRRELVMRMGRKLMLQQSRGLRVDPDKILIAMIHRIADQKGFQLLLEASPRMFCELGYQAIIGGAVAPGDGRGEELAHGLRMLERHYPHDVSVRFGFEDVTAPFLAADIVAMPSLSEPGGLVQLEAFACGALVLARATGGLRDTVQAIRIEHGQVVGNGFLFEEYSAHAFAEAGARASHFLRSATQEQLYAARRNAEHSVLDWSQAAAKYIAQVYAHKELLHLPSELGRVVHVAEFTRGTRASRPHHGDLIGCG